MSAISPTSNIYHNHCYCSDRPAPNISSVVIIKKIFDSFNSVLDLGKLIFLNKSDIPTNNKLISLATIIQDVRKRYIERAAAFCSSDFDYRFNIHQSSMTDTAKIKIINASFRKIIQKKMEESEILTLIVKNIIGKYNDKKRVVDTHYLMEKLFNRANKHDRMASTLVDALDFLIKKAQFEIQRPDVYFINIRDLKQKLYYGFITAERINTKNQFGHGLLEQSIIKLRNSPYLKEICTLLIRYGADIDNDDQFLRTPLYHAIEMCREDICRLLIENHATEYFLSRFYMSAIHHAVLKNNPLICKLLIEKEFLINHEDFYGKRPIHYAAKANKVECLELLLQNGVNPTVKSKKGNTPLHYAAMGDTVHSLDLLLQNGADPRVKNKKGYTPLHYGAKYGNMDHCRKLIENGAKPTVKNKKRETPSKLAQKHGHEELSIFLDDKKYKKSIKSTIKKKLTQLFRKTLP